MLQLHFTLKHEKPIYLGKIESDVYRKIETRLYEIERQISHLEMLLNFEFVLDVDHNGRWWWYFGIGDFP